MLAIQGGLVHTITYGSLKDATILLDSGRILDVGYHLQLPADTKIINAHGKVVTPGLIDCHTHLGIAQEGVGEAHIDKNEVNQPISPELRAIDGINPEDAGLSDAVSGGITTIIVTPGSENVIGGQSAAIKTFGRVIDDMIMRQPAGIKMAFGENPIKMYMNKGRSPSTRMTIAGMIRTVLVQAQNYARKSAKGQADRDLRMEALVELLEGRIPMRAHAHAADDIMTAIRIAEEFHLRLTLEHATAGHKIAEEIARREIPTAIGPSITARVKVELSDRTYRTPALLHAAGVKIALITDHPFLPINGLRMEAALAIREGLPYDAALKALTMNAAEIIGVSHRVGSLEPGKDADIVIFDGDPFEVRTRVEKVYLGGNSIWQGPGTAD